MQTQRVLDAGELAELVGAVFRYNGLHAVDVTFDVSEGLKAIVTCEDEPLRVRDSPELPLDPMSQAMLRRMRERSNN